MSPEQARTLYEDALREYRADELLQHEVQRRLVARLKFIESLCDLYPELATHGAKPAADASGNPGETNLSSMLRLPRGKAAARVVLESRPGIWMSVKSVHEELRQRGLFNPEASDPEAATRQSLYRLADEDTSIRRATVDGALKFAYMPPGEKA